MDIRRLVTQRPRNPAQLFCLSMQSRHWYAEVMWQALHFPGEACTTGVDWVPSLPGVPSQRSRLGAVVFPDHISCSLSPLIKSVVRPRIMWQKCYHTALIVRLSNNPYKVSHAMIVLPPPPSSSSWTIFTRVELCLWKQKRRRKCVCVRVCVCVCVCAWERACVCVAHSGNWQKSMLHSGNWQKSGDLGQVACSDFGCYCFLTVAVIAVVTARPCNLMMIFFMCVRVSVCHCVNVCVFVLRRWRVVRL